MTSGSPYERELKKALEQKGWVVIRSAGSQAVDLVALDPENGHTLLLEVKSFKPNVFRVTKTKESKEQFKEMCRLETLFNGHVSVFYALRKKGQGDFRLVHPHILEKPFHWNKQGDGRGRKAVRA